MNEGINYIRNKNMKKGVENENKNITNSQVILRDVTWNIRNRTWQM